MTSCGAGAGGSRSYAIPTHIQGWSKHELQLMDKTREIEVRNPRGVSAPESRGRKGRDLGFLLLSLHTTFVKFASQVRRLSAGGTSGLNQLNQGGLQVEDEAMEPAPSPQLPATVWRPCKAGRDRVP